MRRAAALGIVALAASVAHGHYVVYSHQGAPFLGTLENASAPLEWARGELFEHALVHASVYVDGYGIRYTNAPLRDDLVERGWHAAECNATQAALCCTHHGCILPARGAVRVSPPGGNSSSAFLGTLRAGCRLAESATGRVIDVAASRYDVSLCDVFDNDLRVAYDSGRCVVYVTRLARTNVAVVLLVATVLLGTKGVCERLTDVGGGGPTPAPFAPALGLAALGVVHLQFSSPSAGVLLSDTRVFFTASDTAMYHTTLAYSAASALVSLPRASVGGFASLLAAAASTAYASFDTVTHAALVFAIVVQISTRLHIFATIGHAAKVEIALDSAYVYAYYELVLRSADAVFSEDTLAIGAATTLCAAALVSEYIIVAAKTR